MGKKRRSRAFKETNQVINFEEERQKRREKRKQQNEKKKGRQEAEPLVSPRRNTKKWKRRYAFLLAGVLLVSMIGYSVYNVVTLRIEREQAEAAKVALEKERAKLQKEYSLVDSDEYIEEKAREDLHMIRPGEVIYVLPKESKTSGTAITGGAVASTTNDALEASGAGITDGDGEKNGFLDKVAATFDDLKDKIKTLLRNL